MKGDFTRDTFDPAKHFSRVLMQQGRVTLDADYNEQTAILLHYLQTLARDLIGPYGAPLEHRGFLLSPDAATGGIMIAKGRCYVHGLLVENHQDCLYIAQPDYRPSAEDPLLNEIRAQPRTDKVYWLYLDVWERHVTSIEDNSIREKALNGPDTCTRAKMTWQVKALAVNEASQTKITELNQEADRINKKAKPLSDADNARLIDIHPEIDEITAFIDKLLPPLEGDLGPICNTPLKLLAPRNAMMSARVDPGKKVVDACVTPPDAKYRGTENQLYRVEIHGSGAAGTATFKWSRDNGSVASAWLGTSDNSLLVSHARGFEAGNWVELSDDSGDLLGLSGVLVKLAKVEADTLSVDLSSVPSPAALAWSDQLVNPKVRRWDQSRSQSTNLRQGAIPIEEGLWISLEDGIQIKFNNDGEYRIGDYWLIPARVATGEIEWPHTDAVPNALPSHGIKHHYAPLGFAWWMEKKSPNLRTCGCEFKPLCFQVDGVTPIALPRPGGRRRRGGPG